jgi:ribosomal protein S18 acetylase RimI-like enzyme
MDKADFGAFPPGTLAGMLTAAYAANEEITAANREDWRVFDAFVYEHLAVMENCGFVSMLGSEPVGFVTWDPRGLPDEVKIGHNCILPAYRGRGLGREQLGAALERIRARRPACVTVITGSTPFYLPARRMYEALGFTADPHACCGGPNRVAYRIDRLAP